MSSSELASERHGSWWDSLAGVVLYGTESYVRVGAVTDVAVRATGPEQLCVRMPSFRRFVAI
jgi:hypothetical protein